MAKLISVLEAGQIQSGLHPGLPEEAGPLWFDGRNVVWTANGVAKMAGWQTLVQNTAALGAVIGGIEQSRVADVNRLFFGTETNLFVYFSDTATIDIVGAAYTNQNWSIVDFGTWFLATNGVDLPQIWKNTGVAAPLAGTNFTTAEIFLQRGPHIVAFNTSNGGNWMQWCDIDNPEDWVPTPINAARDLPIREIDGDITAAVFLGDNIAIYGVDRMVVSQYRGAPFYFGTRPAIDGIGAVGKYAVASVGRQNFGLSDSGFFRTDGVSFQYIDESVKNWINDNFNTAAKATVRAFHNENTQEVHWNIPTGASATPDTQLTFNYQKGLWSIKDHAWSAATQRGVFNFPVTARGDTIFLLENGVNADTEILSAYIETKPMNLGAPDVWKYLDVIRAISKRDTGLQVWLGVQDEVDDPVRWSGPFSLDGVSKAFPRDSGVFVRLKFESTTIDADWVLNGFELYGQAAADEI
jgi:hypothetical protein